MNEEQSVAVSTTNEEDLIDIDKELCHAKESDWLFKSKKENERFSSSSNEPYINTLNMHYSFNELKFSSPYVHNLVKSIYQNGNSKRMLHNLLSLSDNRMSISYNQYYTSCTLPRVSHETNPMVYSQITMPVSRSFCRKNQRYSVIPLPNDDDDLNSSTIHDDESPTDSLNASQTMMSKENQFPDIIDLPLDERMTQSSISDYNSAVYTPQESKSSAPQFKQNSNNTQNVLSRTFDKEDLDKLKQQMMQNGGSSQMSQSVYVPPNIHDNDIEIDINPNYKPITKETKEKASITPTKKLKNDAVMMRSFITPSQMKKQTQQVQQPKYLKRLFPTTTTDIIRNKSPNNHELKLKKNQSPTNHFNTLESNFHQMNLAKLKLPMHEPNHHSTNNMIMTKNLLKITDEMLDDKVVTPINSPKHVNNTTNNSLNKIPTVNVNNKTNSNQSLNGKSRLRQPMVVKKSPRSSSYYL